MSKIELNIIKRIEAHKNILFLSAVILINCAMRIASRNYISWDMDGFLLKWYDEFAASGGFKALKSTVGNYNLLYQTFLAAISYLNLEGVDRVQAIKSLSTIFDFLLSFLIAAIISEYKKEKLFEKSFCLSFALVMFLPTLILNSAYWGQCDSIYTFFMLLSVYLLYKEKYVPAFIALGIAFAFKLQTIFILPFGIFYYFYKKRFSIFYIFISLFTLWISGLAAYIHGGDILLPFKIYLYQTRTYPQMHVNIHNIWELLSGIKIDDVWYGVSYEYGSMLAYSLTLIILGSGLYMVIRGDKKPDSIKNIIELAAWSVWTCAMFLPAMHERYTYPTDILLATAALCDKKYIKFAFIEILISSLTYTAYLNNVFPQESWIAIFALGAWVFYSMEVFKAEAETM